MVKARAEFIARPVQPSNMTIIYIGPTYVCQGVIVLYVFPNS